MPRRHEFTKRNGGVRPAIALRETLRRGYKLSDLRSDVLSGIVVGVVALPLSMALAIASGVQPQFGLYTAIIAGGLIAVLGGSMRQISGPTAAFVVLLAPVTKEFGPGGLMLASMIAGLILIGMGIGRFGRMIEFIPYPVTTGFTAGIAVVIASLQVKDFLGLDIKVQPDHFIERLGELWGALGTARWGDVTVGAVTLGLLLFLPKVLRRIPAPLIALPAAAVLAWALTHFGGTAVNTIQTRFGGVPQVLPGLEWPWRQPGLDGQPLDISISMIRHLLGPAFAIAVLGAIESLLSAVVADGMTGDVHDPDTELFAQGAGNVVAPFFGGFAATGAIARTATNIRHGGRSPIAAITHSLFILVAILLLAPLLGYLPMAGLAAMLLVVAKNMAEVDHVAHTIRVAPRGDVYVLLLCITLTIVFDMVISVAAGVVLAALLFMGRMADLAQAERVLHGHAHLREPLPPGMMLYQIAGPLFFGAAQKAASALRSIGDDVRVVIIDVSAVPMMDATGLVSLESMLARLHAQGIYVVITGAQEQPLKLMARAGWKHREWLTIYRSFDQAILLARMLVESDLTHSATAPPSA